MGTGLERAIRAAAVVAGLLALLAVVSLASGRGRPVARGATDVTAVANIRDIVFSATLTLGLFALLVVLWALTQARRQKIPLSRPTGLGSLLTLLVVAVAVGYLVTGLRERFVGEEREQPVPTLPEGPELSPEEVRELAPPGQFRWDAAATVAVLVLGGGAVFLLVYRWRRGPATELEPLGKFELAVAALSALVERTLADLRAEADPRRAVIAAYAETERLLARHGLPRDPSEAPFEYLGRLLAELNVSPEAALALTELFERARFSAHEIDAAMKDEAIDAFVAVRDDLKAAA